MDYSKIVNSAGSAEALFKQESGSSNWWRFHDSSYSSADLKLAPWIDRPESWFSVVVRLPETAKNVYSYDLGDRWKRDHDYAKYQFQTWSIDASVDGLVWREVSSVVSNLPNTVNHNVWRKGGNSLANPSDTRWKISPGIIPQNTLSAGLDWISVAAGATLTSDTCVTARKIVVEAGGGGAVSGFKLADDGVIDVVGVPAKGAFEVALDLSEIELPDGVPILVNGQEDKREVTLSADRKSIKGIPPGLMILVK